MTPANQQEPDDCFRCCIASIMDLPVNAVPNFPGDSNYAQIIQARLFLQPVDLTFTQIAYVCEYLAIVLDAFGRVNDQQYYMVSGVTVDGRPHWAVAHGTRIVHDPSTRLDAIARPYPDGTFQVGILATTGGLPPREKRSTFRRVPADEA